MISLSFFPVFKWQVKDMVLQERLVRALLVPLALADVSGQLGQLLKMRIQLTEYRLRSQLSHG